MQTIILFVLLELLLAFEVHNFSYQVTVTFFNVTRDPVTMVYTTCWHIVVFPQCTSKVHTCVIDLYINHLLFCCKTTVHFRITE